MTDKEYALAFPTLEEHGCNSGQPGMTLREYAAIKLRVPDSGTDWLNDMIRKSQRNEIAARAMQAFAMDQALVGEAETAQDWYNNIVDASLATADAMIAAQELK
jgi:hypothetical protein